MDRLLRGNMGRGAHPPQQQTNNSASPEPSAWRCATGATSSAEEILHHQTRYQPHAFNKTEPTGLTWRRGVLTHSRWWQRIPLEQTNRCYFSRLIGRLRASDSSQERLCHAEGATQWTTARAKGPAAVEYAAASPPGRPWHCGANPRRAQPSPSRAHSPTAAWSR